MAIRRNFDSESSSDDEDFSLNQDMEALRRACLLTGTDPNEMPTTTTTTTTTASSPSISDSDSEMDDVELVRKIQERFNLSSDSKTSEPVYMKPLKSLPPVGLSDDSDDDGYEDDFETLRAIERRFAIYMPSVLEKDTTSISNKSAVAPGTTTTLEQETSHISFVNRKDDDALGDDFLISEEECSSSLPLILCNDTRPWNQPFGSTNWHQPEASKSPTLPSKYAGFPRPKSAHFFVDAVKKNRSFQKLIRNKLIQIEARIEENKKLKERIKLLKDFHLSCKKKAGQALSLKKDARIQLISACKPRNSGTLKVNDKKISPLLFGPVENSHVAHYRMVMQRYPLSLRQERWTDTERENLGKGVKQQFQEMLLQKSLELYSDLSSGDSNTFDDILTSITAFDIPPENVRSFLPKVDWERLASLYVAGRSGAECEARWLNHEDPLINHNPWIKDEEKNLLFILQQQGIHNWIVISTKMGASRTPFQCFARYQRSLNANIVKRDWTEEDDLQLRAAVDAFGVNDWQLVASNVEGRTGAQCSNRWMKTLDPARERVGRWTVEEDKHLKVAVMLFSPKTWNKIAQFVPGRTQVQCRERWVNVLDPSLDLRAWTQGEDSRLKAALLEHGHCWSKVAEAVSHRTDNQCRRRWKVLFPHEVPMLQAARRVQKIAFRSNFVDREEERPALDPTDFLPLAWLNSHTEAEKGNNRSKGENNRAKPNSKKRKDKAVRVDAVSKKRNACIRRSMSRCPEPPLSSQELSSSPQVLRIENGDADVTFSKGSASTMKNKEHKPCKKKKILESECCNQELPLSFEPSTDLNMETFAKDNTTSKKKRKSKQHPQKKKSTNSEFCGHQEFPSSLKQLSTSEVVNGNADETLADENTLLKKKGQCEPRATTSKKKKQCKPRAKRKRDSEPLLTDQGPPLSSKKSTVLKTPDGFDCDETYVKEDTTSKKKRISNSCLKNRLTEQEDFQDVPLFSDTSTLPGITNSHAPLSRGNIAPSKRKRTPKLPSARGMCTGSAQDQHRNNKSRIKDISQSDKIPDDDELLASYMLKKGQCEPCASTSKKKKQCKPRAKRKRDSEPLLTDQGPPLSPKISSVLKTPDGFDCDETYVKEDTTSKKKRISNSRPKNRLTEQEDFQDVPLFSDTSTLPGITNSHAPLSRGNIAPSKRKRTPKLPSARRMCTGSAHDQHRNKKSRIKDISQSEEIPDDDELLASYMLKKPKRRRLTENRGRCTKPAQKQQDFS